MNRAYFVISCLAICAVAQGAEPAWQPAGESAARRLLEVALRKPAKSHFVVEIDEQRTPKTPAEIQQMMDAQKQQIGKKWTPEVESQWRSLAAQEIEGKKTRRVEEWYFKSYYRKDEYDSSLDTSFDPVRQAGLVYPRTDVCTPDPSFSAYQSFIIDHSLKSAILFRSARAPIQYEYRWSVFCMDRELSTPVLSALVDISPDELILLARAHYQNLEKLSCDGALLGQLVAGTHKYWRLEQDSSPRTEGEAPLRLTGTLRLGKESYPMTATYVLAVRAGTTVLISGNVTFDSGERQFSTSRSNFDATAVPRSITTVSVAEGKTRRSETTVKQLDRDATFDEMEIFGLPSREKFPDHTIREATTTAGSILFQPPKPSRSKMGEINWTAVCALALFSALTASFAYTLKRQKAKYA